jgi:hypothetical protein
VRACVPYVCMRVWDCAGSSLLAGVYALSFCTNYDNKLVTWINSVLPTLPCTFSLSEKKNTVLKCTKLKFYQIYIKKYADIYQTK